jgi:uncharacterized damage-inducible protein DinB
MITPLFAQTMARYNRWQNHSLYTAANGLTDAERRLDRSAFFKSIHATFDHLLWADALWMSRVSDAPKPAVGVSDYSWEKLRQERIALDERMIAWADGLDEAWLSANLQWRSGALNRDIVSPRWLVVAHIFNHQTHHRGQAHAMLTAAGAKPEATDLIMMEGSRA